MNIFLCGQKSFGSESLKLIVKLGHRVVGVSSPHYHNAKLPAGTGDNGERPDMLRVEAIRRGLDWRPAGGIRRGALPSGIDLIVAAHSHDFISATVRRATTLGAIGFHPSLLPLHRGRDAVRWTIKMRDRIAGGSVYWFTDQVDAGPVAAQSWCFVRYDDNASSLWRRELFPMGLRLLERVLIDLANGTIVAVPQDHSLATWEPALDSAPIWRPDLPAIGVAVKGMRTITHEVEMHDPRVAMEEIPGPAIARAAMYGIDLELEPTA